MAVSGKMIGPQGVDGYQDDGRILERRLAITGGEEEKDERAPSHMIERHYAS
jgi:hypothetical protein